MGENTRLIKMLLIFLAVLGIAIYISGKIYFDKTENIEQNQIQNIVQEENKMENEENKIENNDVSKTEIKTYSYIQGVVQEDVVNSEVNIANIYEIDNKIYTVSEIGEYLPSKVILSDDTLITGYFTIQQSTFGEKKILIEEGDVLLVTGDGNLMNDGTVEMKADSITILKKAEFEEMKKKKIANNEEIVVEIHTITANDKGEGILICEVPMEDSTNTDSFYDFSFLIGLRLEKNAKKYFYEVSKLKSPNNKIEIGRTDGSSI